MRGLFSAVLFLFLSGALAPAFAGGPRYVTGPPFFRTAGRAIGWRQTQLLYFTDPGDLSAAVNHEAADALVAAAAGSWNIPMARISVARGGALAEHVSGQNVYLDSSGMVWPADAMVANASAVPIVVVYDADGSVTDTLLGVGASDPSGCEQGGVTETVDAFDPAGYILHAVIVLNGRCTGTAPEQQLQLQYQLERVFGRVLGLAWSQTNDNVFTGSPTPSYNQELHWPIMHPINIRCGPYSYQCMLQPFVLRPDDIQAMVSVYPITGTAPAGKQASLTDGNTVTGTITFPTGEGMTGVNVLVRRGITFSSTPQDWYESSTVTGTYFRRQPLSPFVSGDTSATGSEGSVQTALQGSYFFPYMQVQGIYKNDTVIVSTEPVNPLYTGRLSLGPYAPGAVSPAGRAPIPFSAGGVGLGSQVLANFKIADAPSVCGDGADGTLLAPLQEPASGWWKATLCPFGHAAYVTAAVKPDRTFSVEVTALDEDGLATTRELMPVLGVFAASDAAGSLPSIAIQPLAFNSLAVGTTSVHATVSSSGGVRVGVADQRGEGRPDFAYQARFFYADSISPALVPSDGADATITGTGFRTGNLVQVNGVAVTVKSWSANSILLTVPPLSVVGAAAGTPVDVTVRDRGTGAVSTMMGALTFQAAGQPQPNTMLLVAVPGSPASVGAPAFGVFSVRMMASDGVTPVVGATVVFSVGAGSATFGACSGPSCGVSTDANGLAQSSVTPTAAGLLNLQATCGGVQQSVSLTAQLQPLQMKLGGAPANAEVVGQASAAPFYVQVDAKGGGRLANDLVTFSVAPSSVGNAVFSGCSATPCSMVTNGSGQAYMWVTPTAAGMMTLVATDSSGISQQVQITAIEQPMSLKVISSPSFTAYMGSQAGGSTFEALAGDGVSPIRGQLVTMSGSPGLTLGCDPASTCNAYTDYFGAVSVSATAALPGMYAITAKSGSASATTTYTFMAIPSGQLSVLSYPTGVLIPGAQANVPFSVQLVDGFSHPLSDVSVILSLLPGKGVFDCGRSTCSYQTDWNGTVSSLFTPRSGGSLILNAAALGVPYVTANVTVAGGVTTLNVVQAPPANVAVGSQVKTVMQLLGPDGAAIYLATVWIATTQGTLANADCPLGMCKYYTDVNGKVTVSGTVWTTGQVSLEFSTSGLRQTVNFNVFANVMNLKLVTTPIGTVQSGTPAIPFAVQVVGADGATTISGQNVTFSITNGSAALAACASLPCVVKTGANGIASTGVISTSNAGNVNLLASLNGATLSASFNVAAKPDILTLTSFPASVFQTASSNTAFAVKVTLADGVTPVAGVQVGLNQTGLGGVRFTSCGAAVCTGLTDTNGVVSSPVTGASVGPVTLVATAQLSTGNQTVTSMLQVTPSLASMKVVSAPVSSVRSGVAAAAMMIQLTGPDGVAPGAGQIVTFAITNGFGSFASCAVVPCVVTTDKNGLASSGAIATPTVGPVTVTAVSGGLSASVGYTVTPRPDVLSIVQAPASGVQWMVAAAPFVVRLTLADGITPVAGVPVSLIGGGGGAVVFGSCAIAPCTPLTDVNGVVSTTVTGVLPGAVTLAAGVQLATGIQTVTTAYMVLQGTRGITALQPALYVAEGATVATTFDVAVLQNEVPAVITILWSANGSIVLSQPQTQTDSFGRGSEAVSVGPLAAGAQAVASACVWTTSCAEFSATGVSPSSFQLGVLGGSGQTVTGGALYAPMVLEITDSAGHPVSGAAATVGQTVTALAAPCPAQGRCPTATVLASEVTVVATDLNGRVTIQPLQSNSAAGISSQTKIQCSSGLHGSATVVLNSSP